MNKDYLVHGGWGARKQTPVPSRGLKTGADCEEGDVAAATTADICTPSEPAVPPQQTSHSNRPTRHGGKCTGRFPAALFATEKCETV